VNPKKARIVFSREDEKEFEGYKGLFSRKPRVIWRVPFLFIKGKKHREGKWNLRESIRQGVQIRAIAKELLP